MAAVLVTLEQAKAQIELTHGLDDDLLQLKLDAAEAAVLNYLDDAVGDLFLDSSGNLQTGADTPPQVVEAILNLTAILYRYRDDPNLDGKLAHGFLPFSTTALLYGLRDPALA